MFKKNRIAISRIKRKLINLLKDGNILKNWEPLEFACLIMIQNQDLKDLSLISDSTKQIL